jgi:DNA-directed RNA polymerase subunit E"
MRENACKNCRLIINTKICSDCNNTNLSEDWYGEAIIFDPENSLIAKTMNINKSGRYALNVR